MLNSLKSRAIVIYFEVTNEYTKMYIKFKYFSSVTIVAFFNITKYSVIKFDIDNVL